jgi:hypothetical protein
MTWLCIWRQLVLLSPGLRVSAPRRRPPRLEIEALEDRRVPATFTVTNVGDNATDPAAGAGTGTLRQAIIDLNAAPAGLNVIQFDIPGTGVQTIRPLRNLPIIFHQVVLDGDTQPGFAGNPLVELDGATASGHGGGFGLALGGGSDGSIIRGLIISRWSVAGIDVVSTNNQIVGNYIGTDASGSVAEGNGAGIGIDADGNVIGGTGAADRNVISGNTDGVEIALQGVGGTGTFLEGNYIGTDVSGTRALGNRFNGVVIFSSSATDTAIGGTFLTPGAGNLIAFNGAAGVEDQGTNTSILGNAIFANGGLGIDRSDGLGIPQPNTPGGAQNFPVLLSAVSGGGVTTVTGTLNSTANRSFQLEFFADPAADPSGFGQGQTILGSFFIRTGGDGNATFRETLPAVPAGQFISATSTSLAGTSEFAQDIQVAAPTPPPSVSVSAPPAAQPPVLTAFFAPPAKGALAVGGFVSGPAGQLAGLPLVVVIDWGDGRQTFTGLFVGAGGFDFFVPQGHKKAKGHRQITVHVEQLAPTGLGLADVVAPFVLST